MKKSLAKLIEEAEANLDALHRVAALMNVRHTTNGHRNVHTIAKALQLDESRREALTPKKPQKHARGTQSSQKVRAQRAKSAELLAWVVKHKGEALLPVQKRGLGPLVRRGYLKRSGAGYERTDKPFSLELP